MINPDGTHNLTNATACEALDPVESEAGWKWYGTAGHFISAMYCHFHLHTHLGPYCVSTIGEYFPPVKAEALGVMRVYETAVFDTRFDAGRWEPLDVNRSVNRQAAHDNHLALCRKYAEQASLDGEPL